MGAKSAAPNIWNRLGPISFTTVCQEDTGKNSYSMYEDSHAGSWRQESSWKSFPQVSWPGSFLNTWNLNRLEISWQETHWTNYREEDLPPPLTKTTVDFPI
jgi:hypothetical protein